jgi:hypothetical protein
MHYTYKLADIIAAPSFRQKLADIIAAPSFSQKLADIAAPSFSQKLADIAAPSFTQPPLRPYCTSNGHTHLSLAICRVVNYLFCFYYL